MAGHPPPYPPPPGSPFGFDARQQARMARQQVQAQMRAQKIAMRAQRHLYRQQARALRRGSILGPLLVVAIGVALLLIRLGNVPFYSFEAWFSHWWPLVFVAAGVVLVLEWAFDHHSTQEGVPFVRRGIGAGPIFLLILLALTGVSIQSMHDGWGVLSHAHINSGDLGEFLGERHDFEQEIDQPFPAGTTLNVENPHGDVIIVGKSGDDKIHIVVNKQVYSWNGTDASGRADQLSPHVSLSGGTLNVSVPALDAASADLAITVPDTGQTTVTANHGDLNVSDMHAAVNVTSNHGDIEIDRIGAPVTIHVSSSSSSVSAHGIHGDLTLRGHADDMNVTDVTGAVSLEGEFWGDAHLENLAGPVGFRTSRTQFSAAKLDGMVDISNGSEMTGSQIVGPMELHTRSRNIAFERVAGSVDITDSSGTVDLTAAAPLGNISIDNQNGEVNVTLPEHPSVTIETLTKDGSISDELDDTEIPEKDVATHSDTVGNGSAHLSVHTTHADINIHKGIVEPPSVPAAPTPPASTPEPPATKHHPAAPKKPAPPADPTLKST
jgi:DUF4097 and DUF4098 domain-containing protein YvlB